MDSLLADFSKILVALFTLAIIAVVVSSGQASQFIGDLGKFLVAMVNKVYGRTTTASSGGTATMGTLTATAPNGVTSSGN